MGLQQHMTLLLPGLSSSSSISERLFSEIWSRKAEKMAVLGKDDLALRVVSFVFLTYKLLILDMFLFFCLWQ